VSMIIFIKA